MGDLKAVVYFVVIGILLCGCESGGRSAGGLALEGKSEAEVTLIKRGKTVYAAQCTACHNANPKAPGALGPAVSESSLELLQARILHGNFPPGYTPKTPQGRSQIQMPVMPFLEQDLPALYAYLNSLK